MGSFYAKDFIDNCYANVGAVCGKTNEFSAELDSINYFNGPKNGVANSCAIFLNDMTYRGTRNSDGEIDPDKWDAYYFLYQPSNPAANCGAGCTQQVGYFKAGGAFFTDPSEAERGDWVFFTNDGGETYYHVGAIVDWGYVEELGCDGFTTIEGNTNGGYVAFHYYKYDDYRIGGFGRPRYDGWAIDDKDSNGDGYEPDPEPAPAPDPVDEIVRVDLPVLYKGIDNAEGEVLTIQALLKGFGFKDDDGNEIAIDGIFGSKTEQAVKNYQRARDIDPRGIVDGETWNRILK